MNRQDRSSYFYALDLTPRYKFLLELFSTCREIDDQFEEMYKLLYSYRKTFDEEISKSLFEEVLEVYERYDVMKNKNLDDQLEYAKTYIEDMREMERLQREKENPDCLLENM